MTTVRIKWSYLGALLVAGTLLAGIPWAQAAGQKKTLTGTVSDVMCGVKHKMADAGAAECTRKCAQMGSKYALVAGGTVYELEGKSDEIDKLAGQKAKVSGTVDGKKIQVASIGPAK